jgi:hypothetical protein
MKILQRSTAVLINLLISIGAAVMLIQEYKVMQGSWKNVATGFMEKPPSQPNGVAMHGMVWKKGSGYERASRLSIEALSSVYFMR